MHFSTLVTALAGLVAIVSSAATGKKHFDCEYTGVLPDDVFLISGVCILSDLRCFDLLSTPFVSSLTIEQTCRTGFEHDAGHCEISDEDWRTHFTGDKKPITCDYQYRNADESPCLENVRYSSQFGVSTVLS
jgi:hypothetical protein